MRKIIACTIIIFACPAVAVAACDMDGATIVFVNGVFTDSSKAKVNRLELEKATVRITTETQFCDRCTGSWLQERYFSLATRKGHFIRMRYMNISSRMAFRKSLSPSTTSRRPRVTSQEAEHISHPQTIISSQM